MLKQKICQLWQFEIPFTLLQSLFTDNVKGSTDQSNKLKRVKVLTGCKEHVLSHLIINRVNNVLNGMYHIR